jgi:hypothetical protein
MPMALLSLRAIARQSRCFAYSLCLQRDCHVATLLAMTNFLIACNDSIKNTINHLKMNVQPSIGTAGPALHCKSAFRCAAFAGFPLQSGLG